VAARELAASALGLSVPDFDELLCVSEQRRVACEAVADDSELPIEPGDPEQQLIRRREELALKSRLRAALRDLDPRERAIVERRLMADPEAAPTLLELGDEFGVSRERIRQVEARLKRRLRERLSPQLARADALPREVA